MRDRKFWFSCEYAMTKDEYEQKKADTEDLSYDDFTSAYSNDSFGTIDDSLNMYDDTNNLVHVDYSDGGIVTDVMPMDNMFDYWTDSMSDDMPLGCDS